MPASQRLERRYDVTDEQSSSLEQDCDQAKRNAMQQCRSSGNGDCDEIVQKAGMECTMDNYKPQGTDQIRHDECKAMAIQGVDDCVKKNPKIVGQCRRGLSKAYFRCTGTGPGTPSTEQDPKEDTAPKPEEDKCTEEEDKKPKLEEVEKTKAEKDECTSEEDKKPKLEEVKKTKPKEDECTSEKGTAIEPK
ncbi:hypothetical protein MANI_011801 [Metarhizium anisopliae]